MARNVFVKFLTVLVLLLNCGSAFCYYCKGNYCSSDQYCCGDNLCCSNVYSLWYFWAGVLLVVVMLSSCWFFRYCYAVRPQIIVHQVTNYVPLPTEPSPSSEMNHYIPFEDDDDEEILHEVILPNQSPGNMNLSGLSSSLPRGPPPPYSKAPSSLGLGRKIGYKL